MKISDLLKLSTDNLRRRKGRTLLTLIGVVIGTCLIVVMISLGIAIGKQNEEMLRSYGDLTKIQIYNYSYGGTTENSPPKLDDAMLETLKAIPHVIAATPQYRPQNLGGQIYAGKNDRYQAYMDVMGMDPASLQAMGVTMLSGQYLTGEEVLGKNKIPVIVGENYAYSFEDTRKSYNSGKRYVYQGMVDAQGNPVPPFVDINKDKLTLRMSNYDETNPKTREYELVVMGVMKSDYNVGYYTDSGIVMSIANVKKLEEAYQKLPGSKNNGGGVIISGSGGVMREQDNGYQEVYLKVDDVDNVADVENAVKDLGYTEIGSMTQVREQLQAEVRKQQMTLGGLAAVSLLVAALNIANTMTMAIYERTKEIGVMKVLGCPLGKIRGMFLVESGAIGFIGGIVGVVISYIVSFVLNNLQTIIAFLGIQQNMDSMNNMGGMVDPMMATSQSSIIPPWLVLLAIAFATLVGLLSGVVPANRAVKISALEAIRHE